MPDKKAQVISDVVLSFYKVATVDFLIGYQFRKIQEFQGSSPLTPPIEAFKNHLPRIEKFWRMQLLGEKLNDGERFDLMSIHKDLLVRKGEVNRWVLLFKQTLLAYEMDHPENKDFLKNWNKKIEEFEKRFLTFLF
ncbi:hypothetical protein A9Q84_02515 [Halobacteriovorax marinus]|uniref:Globin n=1 Tax=Halobacteriovorax marinus TaxID=97084 RepID=A0A1Y5FCS0_9BACT|nr:hypothetical protein A9Q84_02515 [Halobacteriovorax marinus]